MRRASVVGLVAVAALGVLQVPSPLTGDQALYLVGGRSLAGGLGLTDGFWIDKTPAILLWYGGVRAVTGEGAAWFRLAEIVWLLGFVSWLAVCLRERYRTAWGATAMPLLVVGTHLAVATPYELGQVEALIGVPLFLAVWGVLPDADGGCPPVRRRALAGVCAAAALAFKQPYLVIPVAAWSVTALRTPGLRRPRWLLPAVLALGTTLVVTCAWIALTGDLGDALWTWFRYAPTTGSMDGRPLARLRSMVAAAVTLEGLAAVLAAIGVVRARRARDPLRDALATWVVVGGVLILAQHWWDYLPIVLVVPVGILAADALDDLASTGWPARRRWGAAALALGLALPAAVRVGERTLDLAHHGFALSTADRVVYRAELEPVVLEARAFRAALEASGAGAADGVYVLGDPQYQYEAGVPYAAAINGWSPEFLTEELWDRLTAELRSSEPGHILVDDFSRAEAEERGGAFLAWLDDRYCLVRRLGDADWYAQRGSSRCASG